MFNPIYLICRASDILITTSHSDRNTSLTLLQSGESFLRTKETDCIVIGKQENQNPIDGSVESQIQAPLHDHTYYQRPVSRFSIFFVAQSCALLVDFQR